MKNLKKSYNSPTKKNLIKNAILPIYCNYKEEEDLLGYARLNFRVDSNISEYPYVRAEIGGDGLKEPDTVIWNSQRWNITYVDPIEYDRNISNEERWKYMYQKGFTTTANISYFVTVSSVKSSGYKIKNNYGDTSDVISDNFNDLF